jgi:hypothetical protein
LREIERLTFVYQYNAGNVQDVWPDAIAEFFLDWLMRKVMVKPPEYPQWPPALRLFYRFLSEKGCISTIRSRASQASIRLNRSSLRWCNSDPEGRRQRNTDGTPLNADQQHHKIWKVHARHGMRAREFFRAVFWVTLSPSPEPLMPPV